MDELPKFSCPVFYNIRGIKERPGCPQLLRTKTFKGFVLALIDNIQKGLVRNT